MFKHVLQVPINDRKKRITVNNSTAEKTLLLSVSGACGTTRRKYKGAILQGCNSSTNPETFLIDTSSCTVEEKNYEKNRVRLRGGGDADLRAYL